MKVMGYKLTLLVFFIALLSGFYLRLPLVDNFIRAFVIYLIFSVVYLSAVLIFNHFTLESLRNNHKEDQSSPDDINQATPNMVK